MVHSVYSSVRRLERFLGYRGPDTLYRRSPQILSNKPPEGELIATIVYYPDGAVEIKRPGGLERKVEEQPKVKK